MFTISAFSFQLNILVKILRGRISSLFFFPALKCDKDSSIFSTSYFHLFLLYFHSSQTDSGYYLERLNFPPFLITNIKRFHQIFTFSSIFSTQFNRFLLHIWRGRFFHIFPALVWNGSPIFLFSFYIFIRVKQNLVSYHARLNFASFFFFPQSCCENQLQYIFIFFYIFLIINHILASYLARLNFTSFFPAL